VVVYVVQKRISISKCPPGGMHETRRGMLGCGRV
jgi:hypothetical protein